MTDPERRRFESLEALRAAAYASFNDRRGYEWKLSLSICRAKGVIHAVIINILLSGNAVTELTCHCARTGKS